MCVSSVVGGMNSSFSVTFSSLSTILGNLFLVKECEMNESLSFLLSLYSVLPLSSCVKLLTAQVPGGFLLSIGEVLPGLAQMVEALEGMTGGAAAWGGGRVPAGA